MTASLWETVDRLVDRADSVDDLRAHGLQLLALQRWRADGRAIPDELRDEERLAAVRVLVARALLERVRAACNGPLVLMKGPAVAARYPDPALRPFADVDVLVPDAAAVQRALLDAGFVELDDPEPYGTKYHRPPLALPGLPLALEVHARPKWVNGVEPPTDELLRTAVPSSLGVAGVLEPAPAHHALLLAAHSWAHEPLRRALDLVDVAVLIEGVDRAEIRALARAFGLARVWRATEGAAEALLDGRRRTWPLLVWARHLPSVRERTMLETHLTRWLGELSAHPRRSALVVVCRTLRRELRPRAGESVGAKLRRGWLVVRNARLARSRHERQLTGPAVPARLRSGEPDH